MSQAQSNFRSPCIAIIGMEQSGKTVLTATLAKRLSTIDGRGVFLNPQGVKTLRYVENVWQTLQSGEWPPSTPAGELFELKWKFQIVGGPQSDLRLIDTAGHDLRLLFGGEQIHIVDALPDQLRSLVEYCRSADIVLFLVNLKDFVGEGNAELRTANEAAIKSAMDYLDGNRSACLVLTQADLFASLATECGGWLELVARHIPYVFNAHIRLKQLTVFAVSAVAQTRVDVDAEGHPRKVPAPGFHSEGFDELLGWLMEQVLQIHEQRSRWLAEPPSPAASAAPAADRLRIKWKHLENYARGWTMAAVIVLFSIGIGVHSCLSSGGGPTSPPPPTAPVAVVESVGHSREGTGLFQTFGISVWGRVINKGAKGNISVKCVVTQDGRKWVGQDDEFFDENQSLPFRFFITGPDQNKQDPLVDLSAK